MLKGAPWSAQITTLVRQLTRWEQSVRDEFARVWRPLKTPWNVRVFNAQTLTCEAQAGDWIQMDCTSADHVVRMPLPTAELTGAQILVRRQGTPGNSLWIRGLDGGSGYLELGLLGAWALFVCSGDEWRHVQG